jgi:hypothetical protein
MCGSQRPANPRTGPLSVTTKFIVILLDSPSDFKGRERFPNQLDATELLAFRNPSRNLIR